MQPSIEERNALVEKNIKLIYRVAKRWVRPGIPMEDLVQEGVFGLIEAIETFDPGRGLQPSTHYSHRIFGRISHYVRQHGRVLRIPGHLSDLWREIGKAERALAAELGAFPSVAQVAERIGQSVAVVTRAYDQYGRHGSGPLSLDAAYGSKDFSFYAKAAAPEAESLEGTDVGWAFSQLSRDDQDLLWRIVIEGWKPGELAGQLGVTPAAVARRKTAALGRLRRHLAALRLHEQRLFES